MSASSIGSTYSKFSGIPALDSLRTAKAETVCERDYIYQFKKEKEKQLKTDCQALAQQSDKARRGVEELTKLIPELERQLETQLYDAYT